MNKINKPLLFFFIIFIGLHTVASAQSTGHDYFGFDLGITGSAYVGNQNFFWPVVLMGYNTQTVLPFDNLGTGAGGLVGAKVGFPLSSTLDIEGKLRYLTNYTTREETNGLPDAIASNSFGTTPQATNNYSLLLSYLDFDALAHLAFGDRWYGIGGLGFSSLLSNKFSATQTLASETYYNGAGTTPGTVVGPKNEQDVFASSRFDLQLGVGSVFPLGSGGTMLDAEFLLSIPFTDWLTSSQQSTTNQVADNYSLPSVTFPKLWYGSLTIGIRFPFGNNAGPSYADESSTGNSSSPTSRVGPDGKVALKGHVTNTKTGDPVDADMTVVDLTNNQVVATGKTDPDGSYDLRVPAPGKYSVTADANGYLFGTTYFEVDPEGRILSRHPDITLSETSSGKTRLLVFFDFGKTDLSHSSYPELDRAVHLMKAVPSMEVEIAGYTDNIGAADYNLALSQKRANAVRDYLIAHGISKARVTAHGYGIVSPIADNSTEEGRSENRRVEFVVTSK